MFTKEPTEVMRLQSSILPMILVSFMVSQILGIIHKVEENTRSANKLEEVNSATGVLGKGIVVLPAIVNTP